MIFLCNSCKKEISLGDEWAGKQAKCPYCGTVVTAPMVTATPAEPAPAEYRENPEPLMTGKRWLGCAVFILIGIGVVLWVVSRGQQ